METLKFLLKGKKADNNRSRDVVTESITWMKIQFENAEIQSEFTEGGANFGYYGCFRVKSLLKDSAIALQMKIAEIDGIPYVHAEVHGEQNQVIFPYFGEIGSEESRLKLLHFIADFRLSTTPETGGPST